MSWERAELDWDLELWETTPAPWPRHVLLRWLRYVDGCVLRGVRYHVPERCCAQIREAAWAGRMPGRRAVHDVSGCGVGEARKLLDRPELWRDPHRQDLAEDPRDALIRELRARIDAIEAERAASSEEPRPGSIRVPPGSDPGTAPIREDVSCAAARVSPGSDPGSIRSRVSSARVHLSPLDPDPDLPPRPTPADPLPEPTTIRIGSTDVPAELTALLDQIEIPRSSAPAFTVGEAFGTWKTAELLAIPAATWRYSSPAKVALGNRIREYLPRRWGPDVVLGCMAPPDEERPARPQRGGYAMPASRPKTAEEHAAEELERAREAIERDPWDQLSYVWGQTIADHGTPADRAAFEARRPPDAGASP